MSEYLHPVTGMKSCMAPDPDTRTPAFIAPKGACDSHCHIFGPHEAFPYHPKSTYHPPDGPKESLASLHAKLGIDRAVIVQASCHGPDNRAMLDAIAGRPNDYRGVCIANDRLQAKISKAKSSVFVGRGELGNQLSKVCQLIMAGVEIPVFKVSIGSFDTHIEQFWKHRDLLRDLDKSISDTVRTLKEIGVWNDTIIMTYSEFGRRAKENGSRGTDHGMAAPHFVLGGKISGAVYGDENVLSSVADSNLRFSIDYRSLYNEILSKHFGFQDNQFATYKDKTLGGLFST